MFTTHQLVIRISPPATEPGRITPSTGRIFGSRLAHEGQQSFQDRGHRPSRLPSLWMIIRPQRVPSWDVMPWSDFAVWKLDIDICIHSICMSTDIYISIYSYVYIYIYTYLLICSFQIVHVKWLAWRLDVLTALRRFFFRSRRWAAWHCASQLKSRRTLRVEETALHEEAKENNESDVPSTTKMA